MNTRLRVSLRFDEFVGRGVTFVRFLSNVRDDDGVRTVVGELTGDTASDPRTSAGYDARPAAE